MPDITMCTGKCPISDYCYRYTAIANPYGQTYSCLEDICVPNSYSEFIPDEKLLDIDNVNIDYTLDDFLLAEIHKAMDKSYERN
jgi:hypothetical protein